MTASNKWQTASRRSWLKMAGAAGLAGLAGCIGGNDGSGSSGNSGGGNSSGGASNSEWPDLSGQQLHFVTDETSDTAKTLWNNISQDFEQATGAETRMEYTSIDGLQRITQLLQARNPPEIYTMNAADASTLWSNNALSPVDAVYEQFVGRIGEPDRQAQVKIDGNQWFVPLWFNTMCHYYRNDISDIVPDTWNKAIEYAEDVNGRNNMQGIYIPAGTGDPMSYQLMGLIYSKEASLMEWRNDQIKVTYNTGSDRKAMVEVLNHLKDMYQYSPPSTDADYTTWSGAIPNGVAGSTAYIGFRPPQQAAEANEPFSNSIKAIPGMPKPSNGSHTTVGAVDGVGTFKGANTETAETFIKFMLQEKYLIDIYMSLTPVHNNPAYPDIRNSEAYKQAISNLPDAWPRDSIDTYLHDVEIRTRPADTDPPNPYTGVSYSSEPIWGLQQDVLINGMNPEESISKWAPRHQQIIDDTQG